MNRRAGKFICLEGIDGSGKSTCAGYIQESLNKGGYETLLTKEPGGTPLGESLAEILKYGAQKISPRTQLLLFFAARRQHLTDIIIPALEKGVWVISDRFIASSYAYQGGGFQLGSHQVAVLEDYLPMISPDITFILDLSIEEAMKRCSGKRKDRFERQDRAFFGRVRSSYLDFASRNQGCYVIDAHQSEEDIRKLIEKQLSSL